MEKEMISIVVTVLNEADSIIRLLDSLRQQTVLPKEIIIIDAGSTDGTTELILDYSRKNKQVPIRLKTFPGINRSQGRNRGIEMAIGSYVGLTDAGCEVKKDWLEKLQTNLLNNQSLAVAGYYQYRVENSWHECFGPFLAVLPENFKMDTFLPSSRSLLISKTAWLKAGKYPEKLNTCEDLVFAKKLKANTKMTVEPDALVLWNLPSDLKHFIRVVAGYAQGDIEAGYKTHIKHNVLVGFRALIVLLIPPLWFPYMLFPILKFKNRVDHDNWWRWPIVQYAADVGVIWGTMRGLWKRING